MDAEILKVVVQHEDSIFIKKSVHLSSMARYLHASLQTRCGREPEGLKVGETVGHLNCVLDKSLFTTEKKIHWKVLWLPINPQKP